MRKKKQKFFSVNEAFPEGTWYQGVSKYHNLAQSQLTKLELLIQKVNDLWPISHSESLRDHDNSSELNILVKERDLASDVSRIFSQMAVEAFLNYYGAVRLGQEVYKDHFERLNPSCKVKELLDICERITVEKEHPILQAIKRITDNRNSLIHANAIKSTGPDDPNKFTAELPETAKESVRSMISFFHEFKLLVLGAEYFLPINIPN